MKARSAKLFQTILGILLIGSLILNVWLWLKIHGFGGWKDEVYMLDGALGTLQALDDFSDGKLRLYTLQGERQTDKFTGKKDGPFEIWARAHVADLTSANEYSDEEYVRFYNDKMRYMYSHPKKFPRQTEKATGSVETNPK